MSEPVWRGISSGGDPEKTYVTLTFGLEDGEVTSFEFFPGVDSYAKTPEFWSSVMEFAADMQEYYRAQPTGPVQTEDEIEW